MAQGFITNQGNVYRPTEYVHEFRDASFTAVAGRIYTLNHPTVGTRQDVTLPSAPADGDQVVLMFQGNNGLGRVISPGPPIHFLGKSGAHWTSRNEYSVIRLAYAASAGVWMVAFATGTWRSDGNELQSMADVESPIPAFYSVTSASGAYYAGNPYITDPVPQVFTSPTMKVGSRVSYRSMYDLRLTDNVGASLLHLEILRRIFSINSGTLTLETTMSPGTYGYGGKAYDFGFNEVTAKFVRTEQTTTTITVYTAPYAAGPWTSIGTFSVATGSFNAFENHALSPNGRYLAVTTPHRDLVIVRIDDSSFTEIYRDTAWSGDSDNGQEFMAWSKDSTKLLASKDTGVHQVLNVTDTAVTLGANTTVATPALGNLNWDATPIAGDDYFGYIYGSASGLGRYYVIYRINLGTFSTGDFGSNIVLAGARFGGRIAYVSGSNIGFRTWNNATGAWVIETPTITAPPSVALGTVALSADGTHLLSFNNTSKAFTLYLFGGSSWDSIGSGTDSNFVVDTRMPRSSGSVGSSGATHLVSGQFQMSVGSPAHAVFPNQVRVSYTDNLGVARTSILSPVLTDGPMSFEWDFVVTSMAGGTAVGTLYVRVRDVETAITNVRLVSGTKLLSSITGSAMCLLRGSPLIGIAG